MIFFLFRQYPLLKYSSIMNVSCLLFLIFVTFFIKRGVFSSGIFLFSLIFLSVHGLYSLYSGNDPVLISRFYIILALIIVSYYAAIKSISYINIFIFLAVTQAFVIIGLEAFMFLNFRFSDYSAIRNYFIDNQFGDIYTYNGFFYHIQIKGNALLLFSYMISFYLYNKTNNKLYLLSSMFLALAVLFCGNLAFYITFLIHAFIFLFLRKARTYNQLLLKVFIFLITFGVFISYSGIEYLVKAYELKFQGANFSSMGTRFDQFNVLIDDLFENVLTALVGQGLGNIVNVQTAVRNYSDYIYYELQAVYFLNQLGVLLFLLFVIINVILTLKFIKPIELRIVYMLYILYALVNPYMLDTNHVVVVFILVSLSSIFSKGGDCSYNGKKHISSYNYI
ncbi:O146 family O-antigen polymerase [Escherichia coli]|uniref:O146 family O-antigen polymerase n=1 Tax=Escherichia coli TaxID=562 RepID=A0AAP6AVS5_ECOLX|nr:O146 family O-antigen polymerase [Escherichia coli]HDQ6852127.1 O146 family O-antigen polymerase [Escherichia coli O146:H28]EEQ2504247.1 O146 family O-antigen polymerase [Escherichia coli]EEQ4614933.1 O146 family O-antigen polymerase [Escherichia coli]EEQ7468527.1 O146 family O-antigen polymerase [Escherichia coli]EEQ8091434.1 O146 family O-antigen polymerase [Escherichia coli]